MYVTPDTSQQSGIAAGSVLRWLWSSLGFAGALLAVGYSELRNRYFGRKASGCLVYDSVYFQDAIDPDGFIDLRKRLGVSWLKKDKNGKRLPTKYTIVVERNPNPSRTVLIHERFLFNYTQAGIIVELIPPPEPPKSSFIGIILGSLLAFTATPVSAVPSPRSVAHGPVLPRSAPRVVGTMPKPVGPPEPECIVAVR